MGNLMVLLAEEWQMGYIISAGVCILIYIIVSISIVRSCRKVGYDVGVSGMIPLLNIFLLLKKRRYSKAYKEAKRGNTNNVPSDDGEEFEL